MKPCHYLFCLLAVLVQLSLAQPLLAQPTDIKKPPPSKPILPKLAPDEWSKLAGEPTRVTLRVKDASRQSITTELSKQSGVPMTIGPGEEEDQKVTLDIAGQPFWTALHEVGRALRVEPRQWGTMREIQLEGDWPDLGKLVPLHPLVALRLIKMSFRRDVWLGLAPGDPREDGERELTLDMAVLLDPKVDALRDGVRLVVQEAVDEQGHDLRGPEAGGGGALWLRRFELPLKWQPEMGKKLARLRGNVKMIVALKREKWEIPDVLNAKNLTKKVRGPLGEETWTLQSVEPVPDELGPRFRVALRRADAQAPVADDVPPEVQDEMQAVEWSLRDWMGMVHLLDAKGRDYEVMGTNDSGEKVELIFGAAQGGDDADKPGVPAKLVIEIPTDVRQVEIPFDVKDVALP